MIALAARLLRRRIALFAVLVAASACAGALELRGFRGVAWGADVQSLGAAQQVSSGDGVQCFQRERENLLYGDAPIRQVRFCFRDDRLFLVIVDAEVGRQALVAEFASSYGAPDEESATRSTWGDGTTRARAEIVGPASGAAASMRIYSGVYEPRENHAHSGGARSDVPHQ